MVVTACYDLLPVKALSYYAEIDNVTYDKSSNSVNFSMPFNYDPQRLKDPKNNVFVHQELEIPKPSTLATPEVITVMPMIRM